MSNRDARRASNRPRGPSKTLLALKALPDAKKYIPIEVRPLLPRPCSTSPSVLDGETLMIHLLNGAVGPCLYQHDVSLNRLVPVVYGRKSFQPSDAVFEQMFCGMSVSQDANRPQSVPASYPRGIVSGTKGDCFVSRTGPSHSFGLSHSVRHKGQVCKPEFTMLSGNGTRSGGTSVGASHQQGNNGGQGQRGSGNAGSGQDPSRGRGNDAPNDRNNGSNGGGGGGNGGGGNGGNGGDDDDGYHPNSRRGMKMRCSICGKVGHFYRDCYSSKAYRLRFDEYAQEFNDNQRRFDREWEEGDFFTSRDRRPGPPPRNRQRFDSPLRELPPQSRQTTESSRQEVRSPVVRSPRQEPAVRSPRQEPPQSNQTTEPARQEVPQQGTSTQSQSQVVPQQSTTAQSPRQVVPQQTSSSSFSQEQLRPGSPPRRSLNAIAYTLMIDPARTICCASAVASGDIYGVDAESSKQRGCV